jgi:hypothetical protein
VLGGGDHSFLSLRCKPLESLSESMILKAFSKRLGAQVGLARRIRLAAEAQRHREISNF